MTFLAGERASAANFVGNSPKLIGTNASLSGLSSVTITITGSYPRLLCYWRARASDANPAEPFGVRVNGDSGSNYLFEKVEANNSTATTPATGSQTYFQAGTCPAANATASYFGNGWFIIDGANTTNGFKTFVGVGVALATTTNAWVGHFSAQWLNTASITSVQFFPTSGNFVSGSAVTVYGIS